MASILYKDYLVVSTAEINRDTLDWKPWTSICWRDNGRQHLHLIKYRYEKFKTAEEAEDYAMKAGKLWVDGTLTD